MAWENYGFAYAIDLRVGLDRSGTIVAWDQESWYPARGGRPGYGTPGNVVTGMLAGLEPAPFSPGAGAPPPASFNNGSNAAPSYVTGCAGGTCGGTGTVKSERVLTHTIASHSSQDRCARRAGCRTPSRTSRSWTNSRRE